MRKISFLLIASFTVFTLQAQQTEILYLSGVDKDNTVDWEFYIDKGMNSGKWTTIPVPSNWELQGFGVYNYGRAPKKQEPSDETAQYRYKFEVPSSFKKKYIEIVFEGVMTDTEVKVNGKLVGPVHQGGFYRFTYNISDLVKIGRENLLEVKVKNWSDDPSVNTAEREADFWVFGGIYRPVYLRAFPKIHIERTAINAKANGDFEIDVFLRGADKVTEVQGQIYDLENNPIGNPFLEEAALAMEKISLSTNVKEPLIWSPEFPNRYKVILQLKKGNKVVHEITEKFGFRTVELRENDGLYVNDVKVMLKGVNRHTFWPSSGRTSSRELSEIDVNLIKDMNMNAVRMSHYPPDVHFLEVCDSLGLFVLDELTGWQTSYSTEIGEKLVKEMMIRDVNHPSIVIWDNGNEGGWNEELDDDFYLYDPQKRPIIHPWAKFRGTDTQHYKDWNCCVDGLFHGNDVFFPTEFLHGLYDGGHGAGLDDFYNSMLENSLSAGGFLWVFSDEGVERSDREKEIDTFRSNAPDGILGPYREKEGSFYTIKEIWSPIYIKYEQLPENFDGSLPVENRFFYTTLNQCAFNWQLVDFTIAKEDTAQTIYAKGEIIADPIKPWEDGFLKIDLPEDWRNHDVLQVSATDPHGREIFTWSWSTGNIRKKMLSSIQKESTGDLIAKIEENENDFRLYAAENEVIIDKSLGRILSIKRSGKLLSLTNGPALDKSFDTNELREIKHYQKGNEYILEFRFTDESTMKKIQYTMLFNGILKINVEYLLKNGYYDYVGAGFNYPEEKVTGITWVGDGPYRVWKNRLKGPRFGLWKKAYNNTITGESWEYPEFKGYHANMSWAKIDNTEMPFTIYFEQPNLYLSLFKPAPPEGAYNENTDGYFPESDIGIMHAISPIGTKFKKAEQVGPQGQKNIVQHHRNPENYQFTLYLDFGD
ncbi:MAG: glycoside hydrolase family 2 TIM barrel-domain containing protein [Bacteroidota bacterium]